MTLLERQLAAEIDFLQSHIPERIQRFWIAYSGGVDSHALLYSMARIRSQLSGIEIRAIHIDHQLSPLSTQWSAHCRQVCQQLQIPYQCIVVDAKAGARESPEAKARAARYDAFRSILKPGDALLTAHHQDDQAETLLLQLLRGSGPRGLAAMPKYSEMSEGWLCRPILELSREQILQYAREQHLQWIDDLSNQDPAFDRNFLRLQVIPLLKQRWPALARTISRSAQLCADAVVMIDAVASEDLRHLIDGSDQRLSITRLQSLTRERQHNAVRAWLERLALPCPPQKTLHQIWTQVIDTQPHAIPCLQWPGAEVRRYRGYLYAMRPLQAFDHRQSITWQLEHAVTVSGVGRICAEAVTGRGLAKVHLRNVTIRFRQGGERCKLPKRGGEHSLKNLFQEMGIVPWMRARIPLIYADGELAAVGDLLVCERFAATENETGLRIVCDYEHPVS